MASSSRESKKEYVKPSRGSLEVVWFKRDLRVADHEPLATAAERGSVLPLYIVEPSMIKAPDFAPRHWTFIRQSLLELRAELSQLGQPLVVRIGEALEVFIRLHALFPDLAIWSHQETTGQLGYDRDSLVRRWAHVQGIELHEMPCKGIRRGGRHRKQWNSVWETFMTSALVEPPASLPPIHGIRPGDIPTPSELGLRADLGTFQKGGSTEAKRLLQSFLAGRGRRTVDISHIHMRRKRVALG